MRIRYSQDTVSGIFFCTAAVIGLALSSRLSFGSPARMGPGFFPTSLSAILLVIGVIILARAWMQHDGEEVGTILLRPLVTLLAGVILFSLLVDRWGFAIAAAMLLVVARTASDRFRPLEVALLTLGLIALSAGVFLFALKLPIRFLPV
jgi:hypothetical protein